VDTTLIKNEQYPYSQVGVRVHSNWQKKCVLDKEKMDRPTSMKMEQVWMAYNGQQAAIMFQHEHQSAI
jgi:hypothetical protein